MVRLIQGMRRRCKARNSQKKARKEWEKQKPPRKVEPLPRGKVQERKKENHDTAAAMPFVFALEMQAGELGDPRVPP
jgi:hypothetical protein